MRWPVVTFSRVIVALGRGAPVESLNVPLIVPPVACAHRRETSDAHRPMKNSSSKENFFIGVALYLLDCNDSQTGRQTHNEVPCFVIFRFWKNVCRGIRYLENNRQIL